MIGAWDKLPQFEGGARMPSALGILKGDRDREEAAFVGSLKLRLAVDGLLDRMRAGDGQRKGPENRDSP